MLLVLVICPPPLLCSVRPGSSSSSPKLKAKKAFVCVPGSGNSCLSASMLRWRSGRSVAMLLTHSPLCYTRLNALISTTACSRPRPFSILLEEPLFSLSTLPPSQSRASNPAARTPMETPARNPSPCPYLQPSSHA